MEKINKKGEFLINWFVVPLMIIGGIAGIGTMIFMVVDDGNLFDAREDFCPTTLMTSG